MYNWRLILSAFIALWSALNRLSIYSYARKYALIWTHSNVNKWWLILSAFLALWSALFWLSIYSYAKNLELIWAHLFIRINDNENDNHSQLRSGQNKAPNSWGQTVNYPNSGQNHLAVLKGRRIDCQGQWTLKSQLQSGSFKISLLGFTPFLIHRFKSKAFTSRVNLTVWQSELRGCDGVRGVL